MKRVNKTLLRYFLVDLSIYAVMVVVYFLLVMRALGQWLTDPYGKSLCVNAAAALILIVVQEVKVEAVTSYLEEHLGMERLE